MKNIALIGFMGTGKTTIGVRLASSLGLTFVDTDTLIEKKVGISINEIFKNYGEVKFRLLEQEVVQEIAEGEKLVIASGGGVVLSERNMDNLKKSSVVICLQATAQAIFERIGKDKSRPLLSGADPSMQLNKLLQARERYYHDADIFIDTSELSIEEVVETILSKLGKWGIENDSARKSKSTISRAEL